MRGQYIENEIAVLSKVGVDYSRRLLVFLIILGVSLFCLTSISFSDDTQQAKSLGKSLGRFINKEVGTKSGVNERIIKPTMSSNIPMKTMYDTYKCSIDNKTYLSSGECADNCTGSCSLVQFNAQLQCPSSEKLIEILAEPTPTGDFNAVISQDTNLDGTLDYQIITPLISGVCTNGFIHCDQGTWNNCKYYVWGIQHKCLSDNTVYPTYGLCTKNCAGECVPNPDDKGIKFYERDDITELASCFCVNQSCGNIFWSAFNEIMSVLGGGITSHISSELGIVISKAEIEPTSSMAKYFGQDPKNCSQIRSVYGSEDPEKYYSTKNIPTDAEVISQSGDPESYYSQLTDSIYMQDVGIDIFNCEIRNFVTLSTVIPPVDVHLSGQVDDDWAGAYWSDTNSEWSVIRMVDYCPGCRWDMSFEHDYSQTPGWHKGDLVWVGFNNCGGEHQNNPDVYVNNEILSLAGHNNSWCWNNISIVVSEPGTYTLCRSGSCSCSSGYRCSINGNYYDSLPECVVACQACDVSANVPQDGSVASVNAGGNTHKIITPSNKIIDVSSWLGYNSGVEHKSWSGSTYFAYIRTPYDELHTAKNDNCNPDPDKCQLKNEQICDYDGQNCVYATKNFNPTGVVPLPSCHNFISTATGKTYVTCVDGSRMYYTDPDTGEEIIITTGDNIWWWIKRTYQCETEQEYDIYKKRIEKVHETTGAGSQYYEYQDIRRIDNNTEIEESGEVPYESDEHGNCTYACITIEPKGRTDVPGNPPPINDTTYVKKIKTCSKDEYGNWVCPVEGSQTIEADCQCMDKSTEAIVAMEVLNQASKDIICSSGSSGGGSKGTSVTIRPYDACLYPLTHEVVFMHNAENDMVRIDNSVFPLTCTGENMSVDNLIYNCVTDADNNTQIDYRFLENCTWNLSPTLTLFKCSATGTAYTTEDECNTNCSEQCYPAGNISSACIDETNCQTIEQSLGGNSTKSIWYEFIKANNNYIVYSKETGQLLLTARTTSGNNTLPGWWCFTDLNGNGEIDEGEAQTCTEGNNTSGIQSYLCPVESTSCNQVFTCSLDGQAYFSQSECESNCRGGNCAMDYTCPLGDHPCVTTDGSNYYCSSYGCIENPTGGGDSSTGENDKQDDGQVDNAGNCVGTIYIFNGQDNRCRKAGIETAYQSCCQHDTVWLGQCKEEEKMLRQRRDAGLCHYVGTYCSKKIPLIGCVQEKNTFCCFNSKLGRIVHEQGRPQLDMDWGEAKSPQCRGFTPDEFQRLDFSKIDLSEYYGDIVTRAQDEMRQIIDNAAQKIQTQLQEN